MAARRKAPAKGKGAAAPPPVTVHDIGWLVANEPSADAFTLRILTFNILAEYHVTPKLYSYCESAYLHHQYRRNKMVAVMERYAPDIICLQEVDHASWKEHYSSALSKLGYDGFYRQRPGDKADGCAILWDQRKLYLADAAVLDYDELVLTNSRSSSGELTYNTTTHNIALLTRLQPLSASPPTDIFVATTHLHWEPKADDIRLVQAKLLVARIRQMLEASGLADPQQGAVILAGDFNAPPTSEVYRFLSSADAGFSSVYANSIAGEPAYTTHIPQCVATVDYIWYSPNSRWMVCKVAEVATTGGHLPTADHPSDHLPLACELAWKEM